VDGRARVIECGGLTVVDDTYNANPASMSAAIETLRAATNGRRVFVMGDMLELGEAGDRLHRAAVGSVLDAGIEVLLTVGEACRIAVDACVTDPRGAVICCPDCASAAHTLGDLVASGDTVWLKGSRLMGLERLVASLERFDGGVIEAGASRREDTTVLPVGSG
jgi:UDP-N-acetylmuramoyl-tripeptide--D-alanyl-D-alanine ligase